MPDTSNAAVGACDFCDEFSGGQLNAYASRYGMPPPKRVIFESGGFCIVPSLGQIVEGHLLIVPDHHICALADLAPEQILRLERLCQDVRSILTSAYGECIFFEHGIRKVGSGGCGIEHAHMHALPVPLRAAPSVLAEMFEGRRIRSLSNIKEELPDSSYIFFEDCCGGRSVFPIDRIPSQYMRKLVAESIGKTDWDWRAGSHESELISTMHRLSSLFSWPAVPHRG